MQKYWALGHGSPSEERHNEARERLTPRWRQWTAITALATALAGAGCSRFHESSARPVSATSARESLRLGKHSFRVTTPSPAAQRVFDRGLTLAYAFSHRAAEDEFRRAAELDPQMAMAWWGVALVNGPHINFPLVPPDRATNAWQALGKAQALAGNASPIEQALIAALAKRYAMPQPDDRAPLDQAYAAAMREVWRKYPSSSDVGTLFAESMMDLRPWDLWMDDGKPQPGTEEIVATLERVLKLNPKHPGANHLYIHAIEASPNPEKAERAADILGPLAPDAGHLVHMPAHIYIQVGRWNDAANSNVKAMEADAIYRAAYPRPGFYAMYMAHNTHFFTFAAMMQGRSEDAIRHARKLVAEIPEDFLQEYSGVADGFMVFVPEVLMRFGRWEEILQEPAPRPNLPLSQALWRFARSVSLNALDRHAELREERARFQEAASKVPAGCTFGNNQASNLLQIASHMLDGEIAARENRFEDAVKELQMAAQIEDKLRYDEPPDWLQPVRHSLGAVYLKMGRPADAEKAYREDLARFPENGWSLFGLVESLKAQGKLKDAHAVNRQFQNAWSRADVPLRASCFCLAER